MNNTLKYFSTIRTKLLAAFLILSLIPFSAVGILSFITSSKAISSIAFEQLSSIRETKKVQVENFFTKQQTDLGFLLEAVKSLKLSAFERLNTVFDLPFSLFLCKVTEKIWQKQIFCLSLHSKSSNTSSVSIVETLHFIEKSYNI